MQTAIGRIWHRWDAVEEFQRLFQIVFQIKAVSSWQMYSTLSMALSITNCIHSLHPVFPPFFGQIPVGTTNAGRGTAGLPGRQPEAHSKPEHIDPAAAPHET